MSNYKFKTLKEKNYKETSPEDKTWVSFKEGIVRDMLDEYPWLTYDDFVDVEDHMLFDLCDYNNYTGSINSFRSLQSLKNRIISNLGEAKFQKFISMMLLGLHYPILKIQNPKRKNPMAYYTGLDKEALEGYLKNYVSMLQKEERENTKSEFIELKNGEILTQKL